MADRTSAKVFRMFFEILSRNPTEENKKIAKEIFDKTSSYDFSPCQMDADFYLEILEIQNYDSWE